MPVFLRHTHFFPDIENWFDAPIVQNCEVKWMNNPVLGQREIVFKHWRS